MFALSTSNATYLCLSIWGSPSGNQFRFHISKLSPKGHPFHIAFIARSVKPNYQLRSEERNGSGVVTLYLNSAPPNGAGGSCSSIYKHVTPHGVKPVNCSRTNDVEITRH